MPLRKKFFLSAMVTLTLVLLLSGVTSNHTTMKAFRNVERQFFRQDMARVQNRLDAELQILRHYAADWGAWDSMYFFMEAPNPLRFDEIIDGASLRALDIDLVVLFDETPRPVVAFAVGPHGDAEPLSKPMLDALERQAALLAERAREGAFDYVLAMEQGVFLVGVSPVLTTNRTGPPRGLMLLGAFMVNRLPAMRTALGTDFDVLPLPSADLPERSSGDVALVPGESGEALVWQRRGNAAVRIAAPRTIYDKGRDAVAASYFWVVLGGVGILAVVTLLLEHFVLARIKRLRTISDAIAAEGLIRVRVPLEGNDEITSLSRSFNSLLHTLENLVIDIPDALFLVDAQGAIVLTNGAAQAALGHDGDTDLRGSDISTFLGEERSEPYGNHDAPGGVREGEQAVFEATLLRMDGSLVPVEVHRRNIEFEDRALSLLLARDLTERKQFEERLAKKAYFDDMTGLPNRNSFIGALNRALHAREALSVAVLNMDHFKLINAQVGNLNGDRVLMTVAERISKLLEPPAQAYRTGGDEFAALMPSGETQEEIPMLVERIGKSVAAPCVLGSESVFPSASIGVVTDISNSGSSAEVIDAALHAIAQARKNGLGRVAYYLPPDSAPDAGGKGNILTLQAEMNSALEKDEFIPFFQPVHSIDSGKLKGFETLARWRHPQKGILPPAAFIPQAEHTGSITALDARMMERALEALAATRALAPSSRLFFTSNASSLFLRNPAVVESVKYLLQRAAVDPTLLTLEVTESALIENLDEVHRKLDLLKACGVRIALDDFGTGYSSLQYIHSLPFDSIKIDRSFVSRIFDCTKTERMIRTIIAMGEDLGFTIVAEGVETAEQLSWLKSAGCSMAQGYYFSQPVPWSEAETMIRGGAAE